MKQKSPVLLIAVILVMAGCAEQSRRQDVLRDRFSAEPDKAVDESAKPVASRDATRDRIFADLDKAVNERVKPALPDAVSQALMPPLQVEMPKTDEAKPLDRRFDLNVNNAPAAQVFMAIVSGTRYSMIVHPDVRDAVSVNLKDVTVMDALDTLREIYGYEYRVQGSRITVLPITMQSRVFRVNYLQASRSGRSDLRISSGSNNDLPTASGAGVAGAPAPDNTTGRQQQRTFESARVTTSSDSNFWGDILKSLSAIVGTADGRSVIVNSQSGVIVVRAMPTELRTVESFLKAMQLIVERQVVLEAKIIEVTLREGFESGINWATFRNSTRTVTGVVNPGFANSNAGTMSTTSTGRSDGLNEPESRSSAVQGGAVFGLALQANNFAELLTFIETQGIVNVLSSPRVAAINNQKAVLKVGQDDFYVTNVSTSSTTSGGSATISPTIVVQPFFSGIALDVTPQIDNNNNVILHVHPQVSRVVEQRKVVDLGTNGVFTLPLASSSINETDTIVRVQDGNIVAIGGLMRQVSLNVASQVPSRGDATGVGQLNLNQQRNTPIIKSEIVILLKPTIVHSDREWQQDLVEARDRIRLLEPLQPPQSPSAK